MPYLVDLGWQIVPKVRVVIVLLQSEIEETDLFDA